MVDEPEWWSRQDHPSCQQLNIKTLLPGIQIFIIRGRQSRGDSIFILGISLLWKTLFLYLSTYIYVSRTYSLLHLPMTHHLTSPVWLFTFIMCLLQLMFGILFLHLSTLLGCFCIQTFLNNRLDNTQWASFISDLLSALLQLHLYFPLNTWQLQDNCKPRRETLSFRIQCVVC